MARPVINLFVKNNTLEVSFNEMALLLKNLNDSVLIFSEEKASKDLLFANATACQLFNC